MASTSSAEKLVSGYREELGETLALGHLLEEPRRGREQTARQARCAHLLVNAAELFGEELVEARDVYWRAIAGARAVVQPLPQLCAADLGGRGILHQVIERHAAVAAQPGLEIADPDIEVLAEPDFGNGASRRRQE